VQARSHASRRALVEAAMALWRVNGFAGTTVTDICKAAGVSKALFYVYFARKEDVLVDAGVFSTEEAHERARELVTQPYELGEVVVEVLAVLERKLRRYPSDLIIEAVLESYRQMHMALEAGASDDILAFFFLDLFERARADGLLPATVDVRQVARIAQSVMTDGIRLWAAGVYGNQSFAEVVGAEIMTIVTGFNAQPAPRRRH
jgi:AcrR family transcriptional regulator